MASSDKELEQQLMEAGIKLVNPPSSVDELLPLLDQVENCLSKVEQSPSKSMQIALAPSLNSLVARQLFRHSDVDVKVAVASCISEITRITAPDAPYEDYQMKDVFQLIVSSFQNLDDMSSQSYVKRTSILETVAKVRSCVVMLDLECDALIIEMFQHFLNAIRDDHPENVFSSMETIMILVLEESEEISPELLSPLLASVKRGNEVEESNPAGESLDEADKDMAAEGGSPKQADPVNDKTPKSIVSNGVAQTGEEDTLVDSCCLKKQDDGNHADQSKSIDMSSNAKTDILDTEKAVTEQSKPAHPTKKRGRKLSSSTKLTEPSESTRIDAEKGAEKLLDDEAHSKDVPVSPRKEPFAEAAVSSENKKEAGSSRPSFPKAVEGKCMTAASPSGSGSLLDESLSKKAARSKKKEILIKESEPSVDDVPKKVLEGEGASDLEAKPKKRSARKVHARVSCEEKTPIATDASNRGSGTTSESETKQLKQSSKKVDSSSKNGDESSLNHSQDKKHRNRGKSTSEKNVTKSSTKDDDMEKFSSPKLVTKLAKDEHQMEETPKVNSKRKCASGSEKASGTREYDASLVNLRVKVWWPRDHAFYEGVIRSYDPVKKKHEVAYDDGDTEILNLKRQKWEIIRDESAPDEGEASDPKSPDIPSEMRSKKKMKPNTDQSAKQEKVDASPLRDGGGSSSKSKSAATKTVRKSKKVSKMDGKSMDDSETVKKAEDEIAGKSKDNTNKSGTKSTDVTLKTASKSKNDDIAPSKTGKSKEEETTPITSKSKQETVKTGKSKQDAKDKSPRSGGKSSANGIGKLKSGSSKVKAIEGKEKPTDSGKPQESMKGKSLSSSKGQEIGGRSGKKRRRV
ncbi:titin homolog isoform X3 [Manihot esculenta]|uniref:titin homolog isoform X3 n=1 Tax=Manihot esculenta TaxID=3983 RepID=UPI001CC5E952|nr:titin homolog isoform X3 [Manihot esculenta]